MTGRVLYVKKRVPVVKFRVLFVKRMIPVVTGRVPFNPGTTNVGRKNHGGRAFATGL